MIKGLHHNAYRCRDSEQTREFYEDFLGLPLQLAFEIKQTITGRVSKVLHRVSTRWQMAPSWLFSKSLMPHLTSSSKVIRSAYRPGSGARSPV